VAFRLVLAAHLACAFGATALFWIPLFVDKGGPLHIRAGRFYSRLIYLTALTGAPLAALLFIQAAEPGARRTAGFLAYLMAILVAPVFHGVRVQQSARTGIPVASGLHTLLSWLAIVAGLVLAVFAIQWREWPYVLLSPVGPVIGVRALLYARRQTANDGGQPSAREEHIVAMLISGIAVHTAMLVFGSSRTLGMKLTGISLYLPWLLPALVGLPLLLWRVKRERDGAMLR
jgi:hypothetical protein